MVSRELCIEYASNFLAIPFARELRFEASFLTGRNEEGVTFNFTNDVFGLYFAFEPAQCAFHRFVITELYFCHFICHLAFRV